MRRFKFRLQHILDMKEHLRKEVELRLGAATAECNRLDMQLQALADQRLQTQRPVADRQAVLADLQYRAGHVAWIDQELQRLSHIRASAEKKRLQVLKEYQKALQEERVLQKLKERREKEYYLAAARHEERYVEDIVADRYIRNGGLDG
ncbi:MAG: flagellar export protein FliJ [Spirochaetaceae bacterium]|mgnify:CR=1 FL=1|nr:MAG: flagellar export protein FliJ [Spirochaetaceae bacterium]